jgi:tetratricopeptide (TPR) repeat protein
MRHRHWLGLLLLVASLAAAGGCGRGVEEMQAADRIRWMYLVRDYEGGYREGLELREQFPDSGRLRAWHLVNMAKHGMGDAAASEAEELTAADPDDPWAWVALGGALRGQNDRRAEALEAIERALRLAPDEPDIGWIYGDTMLVMPDFSGVPELADRYRDAAPNPAEFLVLKARAQFAAWNFDLDPAHIEAALRTLAEARELDPASAGAQLVTGRILNLRRRHDEALPFLRRALELAPESAAVRREYWACILGDPDRSLDEKRTLIEKDIAAFLEERDGYPGALHVVAGVYGDQGLEEKQREIEEEILERFPDSVATEWVLVDRYRAMAWGQAPAERQEEQLRAALRAFIERIHHHHVGLLGHAYRELFYSLIRDPESDPQDLLEAVRGMTRHDDRNFRVTFPAGVIALAERTTLYREAEEIAREGLRRAKAVYEDGRHVYAMSDDYGTFLDRMNGSITDALGWVYFQAGRLEEAEKELLRAHDRIPGDVTNLHHLGQLFERQGDLDRAEGYLLLGFEAPSRGLNPCRESLERLYESRGGGEEGFEEYIRTAEIRDRNQRKREVLGLRLEPPFAVRPFDLEALDGPRISLKSLRGKSVVLNFWGLWCGPCVAELPALQEFYDQYRDEPDVLVVTINNDTNPDTVRPWIEEQGYTFPVLYDDGYVAEGARVASFPTTWFLDREGRVVFHSGYSDHLIEEFSWRIEALRDEGQ